MSDVLVVLTVWKRPENFEHQLRAFRRQSHPVDIAVIDNRPIQSPVYASPSQDIEVMTWSRNGGPSCRFTPAMMDLTHKWCLFYDDDMIPAKGAVDWLVGMAEACEPFSELGVIGRRFAECDDGRYRYKRQNVTRPSRSPVAVDMCCRMHLIKTADIVKVLSLRHELLRIGVEAAEIATHDDLMLLGISDNQRRPKLLPAEPEGSEVIAKELDDSDALHRRDGFMRSRNRLLLALQELKVLY